MIKNDLFQPKLLNFNYVYHGTDLDSALNIKKNGIDFSFSSPKEVHGTGFYTSEDFNFVKENYAVTRGKNNPVTVKFKVSKYSKILDLRYIDDFRIFKSFKKQLHKPGFNIIMQNNGIDGLYDERFKSFVIYNSKILTFIKIIRINND